MDALVATFKARNPNFLPDFNPKFRYQTQAQTSNLLSKGFLRGLPYVNFPLKSTGKNIVSVQRRCSIIYSSLQLLQLLPTRRKERSRAVWSDISATLRAGPKTLARPFSCLPRAANPAAITTIYELSENFNARKSVNITAIRPGGFLILIWGDALGSHLSVDVSGMFESFLITHFFDLFLSGCSTGHWGFALKAVDRILLQ